MNFLIGLLVGVLITIGGAYVHDSAIAGDDKGRNPHALVNWDALSTTIKGVSDDASAGISKFRKGD